MGVTEERRGRDKGREGSIGNARGATGPEVVLCQEPRWRRGAFGGEEAWRFFHRVDAIFHLVTLLTEFAGRLVHF